MAGVLIAGCGYVGSALAAELVGDGHRVWGLRRTPDALPGGVAPLAFDLADPEALRALPDALGTAPDVVVYAAGPGARSEAAYRRAYVDGPGQLADALGELRPARAFFVSSTSVFGQSDGEWVDETSPTEPAGFPGRVLLEAEARFGERWAGAVVLRLGGIYGPGRTRLLESVRSGRARCRPGGPHYTNRIHRDDAAGALRHLIALERPQSLYLGVDTEPADECEVLRYVARCLDAPDPARPREGDADSDVVGGAPRRAGSKRCSSRRLSESGYGFRFPSYREGYAALAGRDRESGVSRGSR